MKSNYKHRGILAALVLCLSTATFATQPSTNPGDATGVGLGLGVGVGLGVGTGGKAHAQGGDASAVGGQSSSQSGAQAGNQLGDLNTGDSGHTFVAPAPVFTVVPQSAGGIVTKSHSAGLIWNAFSWSKSEQSTDPFVGGERLVADYERLCQFETAAMIRQRLYSLLDPAFRELPAQPGVRNLTPGECAALKR